MNKKTLQNITNLATFIFEENEYTLFMNHIHNNDLTNARLVLSDIMTKFDLLFLLQDDQEFISQYKKCNELENLVMDLIISEMEYEEGTNIEFSTI